MTSEVKKVLANGTFVNVATSYNDYTIRSFGSCDKIDG